MSDDRMVTLNNHILLQSVYITTGVRAANGSINWQINHNINNSLHYGS